MFMRDERLGAPSLMGRNLYAGRPKRLDSTSTTSWLRQEFMRRRQAAARLLLTMAALLENDEYSPIGGRWWTGLKITTAFSMSTKPARNSTGQARGRRKVKGQGMDMRTERSMAHGTGAACRPYRAGVLGPDAISGAGRIGAAAQGRGGCSSCRRSRSATPPMIADDLRRQADNFIELEGDLREVLGSARPANRRPERAEGEWPKRTEAPGRPAGAPGVVSAALRALTLPCWARIPRRARALVTGRDRDDPRQCACGMLRMRGHVAVVAARPAGRASAGPSRNGRRWRRDGGAGIWPDGRHGRRAPASIRRAAAGAPIAAAARGRGAARHGQAAGDHAAPADRGLDAAPASPYL